MSCPPEPKVTVPVPKEHSGSAVQLVPASVVPALEVDGVVVVVDVPEPAAGSLPVEPGVTRAGPPAAPSEPVTPGSPAAGETTSGIGPPAAS